MQKLDRNLQCNIPYDSVCLFFDSLKSFDSTKMTSSAFKEGSLVDNPGHDFARTPLWDFLRGGSVNIRTVTTCIWLTISSYWVPWHCFGIWPAENLKSIISLCTTLDIT